MPYCALEHRFGDQGNEPSARIGPSRLLTPCPVLAGRECRAAYAVTFGVDGGALAAADGNGRTCGSSVPSRRNPFRPLSVVN